MSRLQREVVLADEVYEEWSEMRPSDLSTVYKFTRGHCLSVTAVLQELRDPTVSIWQACSRAMRSGMERDIYMQPAAATADAAATTTDAATMTTDEDEVVESATAGRAWIMGQGRRTNESDFVRTNAQRHAHMWYHVVECHEIVFDIELGNLRFFDRRFFTCELITPVDPDMEQFYRLTVCSPMHLLRLKLILHTLPPLSERQLEDWVRAATAVASNNNAALGHFLEKVILSSKEGLKRVGVAVLAECGATGHHTSLKQCPARQITKREVFCVRDIAYFMRQNEPGSPQFERYCHFIPVASNHPDVDAWHVYSFDDATVVIGNQVTVSTAQAHKSSLEWLVTASSLPRNRPLVAVLAFVCKHKDPCVLSLSDQQLACEMQVVQMPALVGVPDNFHSAFEGVVGAGTAGCKTITLVPSGGEAEPWSEDLAMRVCDILAMAKPDSPTAELIQFLRHDANLGGTRKPLLVAAAKAAGVKYSRLTKSELASALLQRAAVHDMQTNIN